MAALNCPQCHRHILAADINIAQLVAKCGHCDAVFSFADTVQGAPPRKPAVFLPIGIEAFSTRLEMEIDISWRKVKSKNIGFFVIFNLIWNGVVLLFVTIALASGEYNILLFISLHAALGIGMLYYLIALLLNTTYIRVSRREISVQHRPLWVPLNKDQAIPAHQVTQLFAREYVSSRTNNRPNYSFAVVAKLAGGTELELLRGCSTRDQARYVEQEIERFLGIADVPMSDEA